MSLWRTSGLRSVSGSAGSAWASGAAAAPQPRLEAAPRVLGEGAELIRCLFDASGAAAGAGSVSAPHVLDTARDDGPDGSLPPQPPQLLHDGRAGEGGRGAENRAAPAAIIVRNPRRAALAVAPPPPAVAGEAVAAVNALASRPPAHNPTAAPAIDVAACLNRMRETAQTAEGVRLAGHAAFFQTTPQLLASALEAVREPRLPDGWRNILAVLEAAAESSGSSCTPPSAGLGGSLGSAGGEPTCIAQPSPPHEHRSLW